MEKVVFIGIDPGNEESGIVIMDNSPNIKLKGKFKNDFILKTLGEWVFEHKVTKIGIETPSSYGAPIGQTTMDTLIWIGIFIRECLNQGIMKPLPIFRKTIKMHFTGDVRSKDSNVRQALINRFGEDHTIKNPNQFYFTEKGSWMNNDIWQALAVACYIMEPHDRPVKNEYEQEQNKLSQSIIKLIGGYD